MDFTIVSLLYVRVRNATQENSFQRKGVHEWIDGKQFSAHAHIPGRSGPPEQGSFDPLRESSRQGLQERYHRAGVDWGVNGRMRDHPQSRRPHSGCESHRKSSCSGLSLG